MTRKYLIVVAGPTASGKTKVAIEIAKHFGTIVLSADSRQCFKEIPIGTAQPSLEEMDGVPHHFIGSHSVHDTMNAGIYEHWALELLNTNFQQHDVAVLCGGTGLYIDALCNGIDEMPSTDATIMAAINEAYRQNGLQWLQETVAKEDPEFWAVAEQQNPSRLLRALAFLKSTGQSITKFRTKTQAQRNFTPIYLALQLDRTLLYQGINNRVDNMIKYGLLEEVAQQYPNKHLKNLATVGYAEFYTFGYWPLNKEDKAQAIEKVKQHSRNYAKRQITWFNKANKYTYFEPHQTDAMIAFIEKTIAEANGGMN